MSSDFTFFLLITPVVYSNHACGIVLLHLWYILITCMIFPDYTCGISRLHVWHFKGSNQQISQGQQDDTKGIIKIYHRCNQKRPNVQSEDITRPKVIRIYHRSVYTYGIFWLHLWYILITFGRVMASDYTFGIFWLHLWYILITFGLVMSSDYTLGPNELGQ
jgi:hypothetical protein